MAMLRPVPGTGGGDGDPGDEEATTCAVGICDGSGWVLREDGLAEPCACRERLIGRAVSRGMGTGIPKRFRGVSFDRKPIVDLDPFVLRPVRTFTEQIDARLDEGDGLWFMGDVGTGKTSLAMLVASEAERRDHSVAIFSVPSLLAEIRATFDSTSESSALDLIRRLSAVDLLVLDDLGAQYQTDWVTEQLYSIVNARWQDQKSIVCTFNTPEPRRSAGASQRLQTEIDYLERSRRRDQPLDPEPTLRQLRDVLNELQHFDLNATGDPIEGLRRSLGSRTFSRLVEICGDPLPIMGPDQRVARA